MEDKISSCVEKIVAIIKQELNPDMYESVIKEKTQKFLFEFIYKDLGIDLQTDNLNEKFIELYNYSREKADILLPFIDVNYDDCTFLKQCVRDNDSDMLEKLLERGADWKSSHILEWVMYNGQIENLKILIKYGADPTIIYKNSSTWDNHPDTRKFIKENYQL
ncbi:ankyrin repeat protein [Saudi moumouvirus]|nr:ankyrin repeat protein [Saudi moumouvirus]